jgi:small subunit ribosomal protein S8|tara:strand:+ start:350 stop:745 length:396 start_codon:yes stop_codon:yes gene_type:complete
MSVHDKIGDFLTVIRNAYSAEKEESVVRHSKLNHSIAKILKEEGYINAVEESSEKNGKFLKLSYKYKNGVSALTDIQRYSKPGCRRYFKSDEIPSVLGGLGISILSTSKGVISDKDARKNKVGGELICTLW